MAGWPSCWLAIWQAYWVARYLAGGWLAGGLASQLAGLLAGWLIGWWLARRLAGIFSDRKNDVFSRETIRCFLAPALSLRRRIPYLSANRLEPRISRDQHIQTCQFKTTNVKIHPAVPLKCTLISSPLVRWKWPTQVGTLGSLWWD